MISQEFLTRKNRQQIPSLPRSSNISNDNIFNFESPATALSLITDQDSEFLETHDFVIPDQQNPPMFPSFNSNFDGFVAPPDFVEENIVASFGNYSNGRGGRGGGGGENVTGDRRHVRMLKNRAAATRSRARSQAYTCQLEKDVARLEEANAKLRTELAIMKMLNVESAAAAIPKKQTLTRTLTA